MTNDLSIKNLALMPPAIIMLLALLAILVLQSLNSFFGFIYITSSLLPIIYFCLHKKTFVFNLSGSMTWLVFAISSLFMFLNISRVVEAHGFVLSDLANIAIILDVINQNTLDRYLANLSHGSGLYLMFGYVGITYFSFERSMKKLGFLALLFSIYSILTSEKWPLIQAFVMVVGIKYAVNQGAYSQFISKLWWVLPLVTGLIVFSLLSRGVSQDQLENKFVEYGLLQFEALGHKLSTSTPENALGLRTFSGPFSVLGIEDRISGVWGQDNYATKYGETNIYTAYYYYFNDFGYFGGLIFNATMVFLWIGVKKNTRLNVLMSVLISVNTLTSFNTPIFVFNSIFFGLLAGLFLVLPKVSYESSLRRN